MSDRELVEAMRRGEISSFAEFQLRFAPLLFAEARRARVPEDERDERVTELLDDAIMRLLEPELKLPRAMAAYLVTAFRRRLINSARSANRRARVVSEAAPAMDGYSAGNMVALASEATRSASAGPGADAPFHSPAVTHFVLILARELTEDERRILEWSASQVPQREIAVWLGIGYEAAGRRVRRLRARLVAASRVYLAQLDPHDRATIERLIRRGAITSTSAPPRESLR